MLKLIPVNQLKLGMYVQGFNGSWIDHPFWRFKMVLDDSSLLEKILESPVKEVWIDISKGLDVESDPVPEDDLPEQSKIIQTDALEEPAKGAEVILKPVTSGVQVPLEDEIDRAQKICGKARLAVAAMFQEARMGKALDAKRAMPIVDEISNSIIRNPHALIGLARLKVKDDYTYLHSVAVCALMVSLAHQLKLDDQQVREVGIGGLLHDIGKMMIPDSILNKPGKLTKAEFDVMKSHSEKGYGILSKTKGVPQIALDICLHHHEKMDGTGYPGKLAGEQISLFARMGAVCDVYDAITSNRPYKAGWEPAESIRRMAEWSGDHFDPSVFQAFVKSVGIYPVGSLVRLESGRLGVVVEQSEKSLLTPKVNIFYSTKSRTYIPPSLVDLSLPGNSESIVGREDPEKWKLKNIHEFWAGSHN